MKLFDIDVRIMACVKIDDKRMLDTETGEIVDLEAIEALEMERDTSSKILVAGTSNCWPRQMQSRQKKMLWQNVKRCAAIRPKA